ncbi:MAG TPA: hypothetical protein VNJ01_07515 [Bacteriovoracaceae bacterium]|nr:hypothetical protein [Bacteriovoracaceae bacterium]
MRYIFLLWLIASCASSRPTPYQVMKKNEGYKEKMLDELQVVVFRGNSHSKKSKARFYAEFRAIELCRESGFKLANIFEFLDKTTSKEVVHTTSFGPSYYYGMSPFHNRYSGLGLSAGFGNSNSDSWKETYIYPYVEAVYKCSNTVVRPQLSLREVSPEEMKHLVKDLKGAIQIEKITVESAHKGMLRPGDIILKAKELRVQKAYEFLTVFGPEDSGQDIRILRDGERLVVRVKGQDVSPEIASHQQQVVDQACKEKEIKDRPICKK